MNSVSRAPCRKCGGKHSAPHAFLMTCVRCKHTWHHRCHEPPIPDTELITRIKAFNSGDFENGIGGWRCANCVKGKGKEILDSTITRKEFIAPAPVPPRSQEQVRMKSSTRAAAPSAPSQHSNPTSTSNQKFSHSSKPNQPRYKSLGRPLLRAEPTKSHSHNLVDLTLLSDDEPKPPKPERVSPVPVQPKPVLEPQDSIMLSDSDYMPEPSKHEQSPSPMQPESTSGQEPVAEPMDISEPSVVQEPSVKVEPTVKQEVKQEVTSLHEPLMNLDPWQKFHLAPSWIHRRCSNGKIVDPWQRFYEKGMSSDRTLPSKRKLMAKHLTNRSAQNDFKFSSEAWLQARKSHPVT